MWRSGRSTRLRLASAVGARSCVRWFLRNMPRAEEERGATDGDDGASCCNCGGGGGARGHKEKELLAVLAGLCAGGHLELAKALVGERSLQEGGDGDGDGSGGVPVPATGIVGGCSQQLTRWWRDECGLVWPDDDRDVVELIRSRTGENSLLYRVCQGGHIEAAKWVVERFRITELWEAVEPLLGALSHGHLAVAQWLYDEFPGCGELMQRVGVDARSVFHSVEVVEWAMERFPRCLQCEDPKYLIPVVCAGAHPDDRETLGLCKWVKEKFSLDKVDIRYLTHLTGVLKWAVSAFNIELTTETVLSFSSRFNPDFIQWAVIEKNISPTTELFRKTCKNHYCTVSHVKWLMERTPPLTREQLQKSLLGALECNNLEVAVWLDDSFHLMEEISADSKSLVPSFLEVWKNARGTTGTKWFLQHISSLQMIPESSVVQVLKESRDFELISLLLETFHLNSSLLKHIWKQTEMNVRLGEASVWGGIPEIKQWISWMGEDAITKEYISQFLVVDDMWVGVSSKVMKWFIVHYALESEQVKANDNLVLFKLIYKGKNHCAEWIIKNFGVTYPEVIKMIAKWGGRSPFRVDLRTWQLLLRNFPSLTPDVVRDHFLTLALSSPATAKFVLRTFPTITKADMRVHASTCTSLFINFSNETLLWLDEDSRRGVTGRVYRHL
ncbi:hypothetical protein Pelo_16470 [Pelomyxa schiedti]|nr:hypothetical protein Pelo_16470 [Pelomyxa schiedti]